MVLFKPCSARDDLKHPASCPQGCSGDHMALKFEVESFTSKKKKKKHLKPWTTSVAKDIFFLELEASNY